MSAPRTNVLEEVDRARAETGEVRRSITYPSAPKGADRVVWRSAA